MCGIAGFFSPQASQRDVEYTIRAMTDTVHHRGPDDAGSWHDAGANVWLGHRRLSILDLSPAGHQPMQSASARFVIVFNGEIYNYVDLRGELGAPPVGGWRGHSDTETLLTGFDRWGIEGTLKRAIGMFAMAVWDRAERKLTLARDRLGEKPLYYGWQAGTFLFGSELKALRRHPAFGAPIDRQALSLFFRHNYIPAPYSIYQGIFKLLPGTMLALTEDVRDSLPTPYWSARERIERARAAGFEGTSEQAVDELEALLRDAIGKQMVADVPLGAFLSGGVDSSLIVALMQAQSPRPVRTFSIGFHESGYNEAEYAKAVAQHLGTDHTELYVTSAEALSVVPRLPNVYDEPFADSSQIPTFLVSQMARRHVTVSLSGDAGDELFGGYERYRWAERIWQAERLVPSPVRNAVANGIGAVTLQTWGRIFAGIGRGLPRQLRVARPEEKLQKLQEVLRARTAEAVYYRLISHWICPEALVLGGGEPPTVLTDSAQWPSLGNFTHWMMYLDLVSYLPDDILVKVDRAAMSLSLETRVPFLDHRVVEFAWQLPFEYKVRDDQSKWALRQVLYRHVPPALIERPKMGFGVPIDTWLRGPLRDWSEALLDEGRLRREGYLDPDPIRRLWREHLDGTRNWQYHLWDVLMFQAWLESGRAVSPQNSDDLPHALDAKSP